MTYDHTPTWDQIRDGYAMSRLDNDARFGAMADAWAAADRWLAAHDREVREQVAQEIEAAIPYDDDLYDRSWAAGLYDAACIARGEQA